MQWTAEIHAVAATGKTAIAALEWARGGARE